MSEAPSLGGRLRNLARSLEATRRDYFGRLQAATRDAERTLAASAQEASAAESAARQRAQSSLAEAQRERAEASRSISDQRQQALQEAERSASAARVDFLSAELKTGERRKIAGCLTGVLSSVVIGVVLTAAFEGIRFGTAADRQDGAMFIALISGTVLGLAVFFAFPSVVRSFYKKRRAAVEATHAAAVDRAAQSAQAQFSPIETRYRERERQTREVESGELASVAQARSARDTAIRATYASRVAGLDQALAESCSILASQHGRLRSDAGLGAMVWTDPAWQAWSAAREMPELLRIGDLSPGRAGQPFAIPALVPFPGRGPLVLAGSGAARTRLLDWLPGALVRVLGATPPGRVQLSLIDPVGRGESVAELMPLRKHGADWLLGGLVGTEPRDIEQKLIEQTQRIEEVIRTYLHPPVETLAQYNAQATVRQGYRVLVVVDFPTGFGEDAQQRLLSIARNGPRCGVFPIVLIDLASLEREKSRYRRLVSPDELAGEGTLILEKDGDFVLSSEELSKFPVSLEPAPEAALTARILKGVGKAAESGRRVRVPFEAIAPAAREWWLADSREFVSAAVGYYGTAVQEFVLGKGTAHHGLVAGRTGSGKTNLFHTLILGLALRYAPDELELYLVDFKTGVEFKAYAVHRLPHARVIAIDSDREFALSVLRKLDEEFRNRGEMLRTLGQGEARDIAGFRRKTGRRLSRILLIIDEFHELFTRDDTIGTAASEILERLVKEGRGLGIHVLLGSQSLAGASIPRSTADQMGTRIALQCSEVDSRLILSDDNPAARTLSNPGEAIYNDRNGLVEGNRPFQVAETTEDARRTYLGRISELANAHPDRVRREGPLRVFEGDEKARLLEDELSAALSGVKSLPAGPAWLGEPIAVRNDPVTARLRRQSASNLLIVGQDEPAALAMLVASTISLAAHAFGQEQWSWAADQHGFYLLDFGSTESPEPVSSATLFGALAGGLPIPVRLGPRKDVAAVIDALDRQVRERLDGAGVRRPPVYLLLHGLQRARDLRAEDGFGSRYGSAGSASSPANQLAFVLREGPDVGVHALVSCDTVHNLSRSLPRGVSREFGLRVVMQMNRDDSQNVIDTATGGDLGPNRALFLDEETGRPEKFRPYELPSREWCERALAAVASMRRR